MEIKSDLGEILQERMEGVWAEGYRVTDDMVSADCFSALFGAGGYIEPTRMQRVRSWLKSLPHLRIRVYDARYESSEW